MKKIITLLLILMLIASVERVQAQAFTFTSSQLEYSENFDGMGPAGTAYITGWTAIRAAGTGAVGAELTMAVTDGTANSGNIYNVGTTDAIERAFGSLASGSTVPSFGASYTNNTGSSIVQIELDGMMEQWRSGSNASVNEIFKFEYSLDATSLNTGTWISVPNFDLVEKIIASTVAGPLNGNLPENQTSISASISGINWTPGATMWIRWTDVNDGGSDGICAIDNLNMNVTTGTVVADPEPSNYPTSLSVSPLGLSIKASWTDATGAQLPSAYVVMISKNSTFTAPVDGVFMVDDLNLSDGAGVKNVAFGIQDYTFSGLEPATVYYINVYSYTNSGTLVNFKTDGTSPTGNAKTQALVQKFSFESKDLAPWTQFSVTGDQLWSVDTLHGLNNSYCAKMSGYAGGNLANEDWLISPALDLTFNADVKVQFYSAFNYDGTPLQFMVSTDYSSGAPSTATWTDISSNATFSVGGWVWTPSGFVSIGVATNNVHIAFKYTSDLAAARTWEIDEVVIVGNSGLGYKETPSMDSFSSIYPNPACNVLNVALNEMDKYQVSIYSLQGKLVYSEKCENQVSNFDISIVPAGMYLVTVENLLTNIKEVHKLIVK